MNNENQPKLEELVEKWKPVLDDPRFDKIESQTIREDTAVLLENQEKEISRASLNEVANANNTANVAGFPSVLIQMVRRAAPATIAYDVAGVQPMDKPTGLIFSLKANYTNATSKGATGNADGNEALFNEADSAFTGIPGTNALEDSAAGAMNSGRTIGQMAGSAMTTANAEALGDNANSTTTWAEMHFTIEKTPVEAKSRQLRANYTHELIQDLQAVHNIDAGGLLSNLMIEEINAEMNREIMRKIYKTGIVGAQNTKVPGFFRLNVDTGNEAYRDSKGRWEGEQYQTLAFQIEREANAIWMATRRQRGNIIITSADVVSALAIAGKMKFSAPVEAMGSGLNSEVNASGCYAGVWNGRFKVYVDPYLSLNRSDSVELEPEYSGTAGTGTGAHPAVTETKTLHLVTVAYKGSRIDAGIYYCPYVGLQQYSTISEDQLQPIMAYKTRYGLVTNPFVGVWDGTDPASGKLVASQNPYFRKFLVAGL